MSEPLYTENGLTAEGFKFYTAKAKLMSEKSLEFAVKDCHECIENGISENRYKDESSCYYQELDKRIAKRAKIKVVPPLLPSIVVAADNKFYEDELHFPMCAKCARDRRNSPFEKTRPVKEILNPTEKCYWCDAEPTKQEEVDAKV